MMSQSLRASRSLFARVARQQVSSASRRTFLTSAVRQADPVQDLYLRELRAFKPTPVKPGDAEAHVQKFSIPATPQSPEEANLANELKSYETQEVEVEGQAAAGEAAPVEESWFEEDEEEAPAAH
ncbi:ATP synthase complex subunit H-domain-containing protein [Aspergillus bertholletiae]|uniref:ATP synthase complex subunit H-domain-containing protein n=1 Tax=Aspergillus bertholletiae TaxID=1226010 RepID=A0A5N7BLA6_9EURO|nr:ATP synthase complex subunit H-domain-containing protein [Aspergillus bertholletiae]